MIDLIIPLGGGSKSKNDELRIFLRSLEKYGRGIRNVIVVASDPPAWLTNVRIIQMDDPLKHNKDGNIIRKVLTAIASEDITPEFAWSSDDCVLLSEFDFESLPPVFNARCKADFPENGSIWQRRVRRTFEYLEARGLHLSHNYESHTPQRFPTRKLLRAMRNVDYQSGIGYTINTLFCGLLGITGGFDQAIFKRTCETEATGKDAKLSRILCGYNDRAFLGGLRSRLFKLFPQKSKYEKE